MALVWIDGFEGYGSTAGSAPSPTDIMARKYGTSVDEAFIDLAAGRFGGTCLYLNTTSIIIGTPWLTSDLTLVAGCAAKFNGNATLAFLEFRDYDTLGMNLQFTEDGEIAVRRGTTEIARTSGLRLLSRVWYYIEFKVYSHATAGTYEVRVNNVSVLSGTGVNTKATGVVNHNMVRFNSGLNQYWWLDDFYVLDGSGTENNDFLGSVQVEAIYPDGAGNSTQWTPSSGANYSCVDEPVVGDADYVETDASGGTDLYTYSATTMTTVVGLQISTDCSETAAGLHDLKTVVRSGASESEDTGQRVGVVGYGTHCRVVTQDPATLAAWTPSAVNAAEFGIKLV
jgi:hypothetical protein